MDKQILISKSNLSTFKEECDNAYLSNKDKKINALTEVTTDITVSNQEDFEQLVSSINNTSGNSVSVLLKEGTYIVPTATPEAITKDNVTIIGENATVIGHH